MQLTPKSLKCIVATIILNEVEKQWIIVEDFLFAYKAVKNPQNPKTPAKQFLTFYLYARKYHVYSGKLSVDKDWEIAGGLFVISDDRMSPKFDMFAFLLVNKFTRCKFHCCSNLLNSFIFLFN